jgi:hypothetical protein
MKHNNFGRFILVIVIVLWAFWEMYPLTSSDLIKKFKERARNPDASYSAITNNINIPSSCKPSAPMTSGLISPALTPRIKPIRPRTF